MNTKVEFRPIKQAVSCLIDDRFNFDLIFLHFNLKAFIFSFF